MLTTIFLKIGRWISEKEKRVHENVDEKQLIEQFTQLIIRLNTYSAEHFSLVIIQSLFSYMIRYKP